MMHKISSKNSTSKQRIGHYREFLVATAICVSWFALMFVSSVPGLFLNIVSESQLGQGISHGVRLIGGLLVVFGLWPILLRSYYRTYPTYLRATGILLPVGKHHRIVLTGFALVAGVLLGIDLAQNGLDGLVEYHTSHGITTLGLAAFASLQPAIVEELIFRGIAFSVLRRRFPVWVAILVPAVLFGLAHIWWGWVRVATTIFVGVLFALLRWRTNNLWGSMAMHFLVNFGFPVPAWLGWSIAMVLTTGLEIGNRFRRKTYD